MGREIERKYKLGSYPSEAIQSGHISMVSRKTIHQSYLAYDGNQELRIRKLEEAGNIEHTHTFKSGHGWNREEIEYAISPEIYTQLLERLGCVPLVKTRTTLDANGVIIEIDEYHQFELQTVEVEFASEQEASSFIPPAWFGMEIGSEEEFRNKQLWLQLQQELA